MSVDKHMEVLDESNAAEAEYEAITFDDFEATFTETWKGTVNIKGKKRQVEFVLADKAFNLMLTESQDKVPALVRDYQNWITQASDNDLLEMNKPFHEG